MALIVADRVQETCNSPGVGVVTLLGAVFQFQTFSVTIGNTNTTFYVIADQFGANWEVGIGTYSSAGNTLTRTIVLSSSNGGALVDFSSGIQNVWNDYPAEYAIYASNNASQVIGQTLISGGAGVSPAWGNATSPPGSPGYYGQFYDITTQIATSPSIPYLVGCALTSISNGVSISAGRITVANSGVYNFQFSIQLTNPTASIAETSFWVRYNSVDIANSASTTGVPIKHGGINGQMILSLNQVFNMAAGDYLELWWHSDVAGILIETLPATLSPVAPQSPGVIFTMLQQAQIGIGYNGLTSATSTLIATGSKTFTTNLTNSQTAFTVGTRVRVAYSVTPANFMEGVVTAFSGTTFTVNVDSIGGSGTFASWTISVAGIQGSNGVTSFSGNSTGLTPATPTTGAITLSGTLNVANGGTGVTTSTGTGNTVLSTSPTLVTPILGTPASGTLTSCTGLPLTTGVTGTLPVVNGGTGVTTSTGTGSTVLSASPTFTGTVNTANLAYTGTLTGGTGVVAIGTNQIYKDASGNVGIGTSSPSKTLDVNGTIGYTSQNVTTQTNYFNIGAAGSIGNATGSKMTFRRNYDNIELVTIDGSGNVTLQKNISVGGAAPTTSGTGITFPAAVDVSSNANTLDDYEEGTWTPTYTGFTITSGTSSTRYTKVGRMITAGIQINAASVSCTAGATFTLPIAATTYSTGVASTTAASSAILVTGAGATVIAAIGAAGNLALTVTYQLAS